MAVVVALGAAAFYFWPTLSKAPVQNETATGGEVGTEPTQNPDLSGTWRSTSDAKFTREIRTDGVIIDRYEGEASAGLNGSWKSIAASELPASIPGTSFVEKTIIEVTWEGGVETTYFVVSDLTATSLTTTDLTGRGEVTTWTRL